MASSQDIQPSKINKTEATVAFIEVHTSLPEFLRPLAHTPALCRIWIWLQSWSFTHVPALPLPVASTDHVYVVSLILNAAQVRRANSNAVALKLISCLPAQRPACRVQVRHANLPDRQLGGACV
jgi:hypothetical protein